MTDPIAEGDLRHAPIIERATRAICQRIFPPSEFTACCGKCTTLEQQARAVIASLREPTEEMITTGDAEFYEWMSSDKTWTRDLVEKGWQAMIDQILK